MDLLTLDIGNTTISACLFLDNEAVHVSKANSDLIEEKDREKFFNRLKIDRKQLKEIEGVMISSVVPNYNSLLLGLLREVVGDKRSEFLSESNSPLPLRVDKPEQVGADIIANSVAAWQKYESNTLVIDFGTATTLDLVANGAYQGSAIAPNLARCLQRLVDGADLIEEKSLRPPDSVVGQTTEAALNSGFFRGFKHLIENLIVDFKREREIEQVVATGGANKQLQKQIEPIDDYDPLLTHKGLKRAWALINGS